jgi:RNA polymerase sigma-70 factor, ECF subfamily
LIERVFRDHWSRVLAHMIGLLGDFDLAEETTQEAFAIASARWARDGQPANPLGWLTATARNRAIDTLRRERTLAAKLQLLDVPENAPESAGEHMSDTSIPDERLELIFACCHPALSQEARVALTLRALGGLGTEQIARAFLVPEQTMKRRLSRAKAKIKATGIPFAVPPEHLLGERLAAVLAIVYLIFNEGYGGHVELAAEALWLARALAELLPGEPEAHGLLALVLLHDSRREARLRDGELVLLEDQDRSLWDAAQLEQGRAALAHALALHGDGPYVLQARLAALQSEQPIDWHGVLAVHERLAALTRSPVVELSRAVAVAQADSAEAALEIVEGLALDDYQYLHSTRAELLRRLGRSCEAQDAYRRALELTRAEPERRFLQRRLAELRAQPEGAPA